VKENNNIEFDEIFRQELGNASAPVPPGVWEGVSASVGSGSGIAAVAVKSAIWMKAAIAVSVIGALAVVGYQVLIKDESEPVVNPVKTENISSNEVHSEQGKKDVPAQIVITEDAAVSKHQTSGHTSHANPRHTSNERSFLDMPVQPKITFYEIKDEISMNYVKDMNENVVPGFDSSKTVKADTEDEEIDVPYIPEKESIALMVDSSYIYIPNVVTPNGDGVNDVYLIDVKGEEFVQILIYNSKSVKLFETKNKNAAWDCKLPNGEMAPEGNYFVRVIYKFKNKPKTTSDTKLKLIK